MTTAPISPAALGVPTLGDGPALRVSTAGVEAAVQALALDPTQIQPGQAVPAASPPTLALEAAVRAAAATQGGLASLLADLNAALSSPDIPAPVAAAAARVLGFQLPVDPPPSAEDLRQAVARSGLFLETQLAMGGETPRAISGASSGATPGPPVADDLKAALLDLRQALQTWAAAAPARPTPSPTPSPAPAMTTTATPTTGEPTLPAAATPTTPVPTTPTQAAPPPPYRDGPMQGQAARASSLPLDAPAELIVSRLVKQAGAALSRQVLMQAASAPATDGPRPPGDRLAAQWLFEIPLATPQGPSVAQFQIDRDGAAAGQAEDRPPVWRARFSVDLDPMGPVHARITVSGGHARVALWAENPETLARLSEQQSDLSEALLDEDLEAQVQVFPGAPVTAAPTAGRFMDKAV